MKIDKSQKILTNRKEKKARKKERKKYTNKNTNKYTKQYFNFFYKNGSVNEKKILTTPTSVNDFEGASSFANRALRQQPAVISRPF